MTALAVQGQTYLDVAAHFAKMASNYEGGCAKVNWRGPELTFGLLAAKVDLSRQDLKALDVGTGTGIVGKLLHDANPDIHVTGIDIAEEMIANVPKGRLDRAFVGDARDLSWSEPGEFKLLISCGVLDFVRDIDRFASEGSRALSRNDSTIAITYEPIDTKFPGHKTLRHNPKRLREIFEAHGFEVIAEQVDVEVYTNFKTGAPVHNNILVAQSVTPEGYC